MTPCHSGARLPPGARLSWLFCAIGFPFMPHFVPFVISIMTLRTREALLQIRDSKGSCGKFVKGITSKAVTLVCDAGSPAGPPSTDVT